MEKEQKNKEKKLNVEQSQIKYDEPMKKHTTFKVGGKRRHIYNNKKRRRTKRSMQFCQRNKNTNNHNRKWK